MDRPRNLIRIVALVALLAAVEPSARAASPREVRPKAKRTAPGVVRSGAVVPPKAGTRPHLNRSGRDAGRSRVEHREGGHGVGGNPHRNAATGPMVASLRSAIARLHQADHDYDGHRVQAIHQLDQAIGAMTPGRGNAGVPHARAAVASRGNGPRLSQAESDAHLRQAHQELLAMEARFGGLGTTAGQHPQAHNHVREAIGHLNTALATR